jgi:hypothetical protein
VKGSYDIFKAEYNHEVLSQGRPTLALRLAGDSLKEFFGQNWEAVVREVKRASHSPRCALSAEQGTSGIHSHHIEPQYSLCYRLHNIQTASGTPPLPRLLSNGHRRSFPGGGK